VRAVKTRGAATAACRGGHVRVNGHAAKPASPVRVGDRVDATLAGQRRVLEVVRIIDKRAGAPLATRCVIDHGAPPPSRAELGDAAAFRRDPGAAPPSGTGASSIASAAADRPQSRVRRGEVVTEQRGRDRVTVLRVPPVIGELGVSVVRRAVSPCSQLASRNLRVL
jgi:ribosome-associated heat shock protein Hsp15